MPLHGAWIVQLFQINQPLLEQNYLPYTAGLLQAYVLHHTPDPTRYIFLPPRFERHPVSTLVGQFRCVDIAGFSCYVWNIGYSLALARALKAHNPEIIIVMGGPQIPDDAHTFMEAHPWVDLCVHGEGEKTFLELLEKVDTRQWQGIAGLSWRDPQGVIHTNPVRPRSRDLSEFPSPYLSGVFDSLFKAYPRQHWIALWETNRGCPFSCSFCDWGSATRNKVIAFPETRLREEIAWFAQHRIDMVYCCDANFGILPRDQTLATELVRIHQQSGFPRSFYVQNTKNVTERAFTIQEQLCRSGLSQSVTLSLQSLSPEVLKKVQRENISLDTYRELQRRFRVLSVPTYTDLLIALPGETLQSFIAGIAQVIEEGQHHQIKFYPVYLLPNAPLSTAESRQQHGLKTVWQPYTAPYTPVRQAAEQLEWQEMLIATNDCSLEDWRAMRVLAWWCELLYFHRKFLQIPLLLAHGMADLPMECLLKAWLYQDLSQTPISAHLRQFLEEKALRIQQGEPELCESPLRAGQRYWWTVEDFVLWGMIQSNTVSAFLAEQQFLLQQLLQAEGVTLPETVLEDSFTLALRLFEVQNRPAPLRLHLRSNLWTVYQGLLLGQQRTWQPQPQILIRPWLGPPFDQLQVEVS